MYLAKTLLLWAGLLFVAYNVGKVFLPRSFRFLSFERFVIPTGLGFGAVSIVVLLLGAAGLLYRAVIIVLTLVAFFFSTVIFIKDVRDRKALISKAEEFPETHLSLIVAVIHVLLVLCVIYSSLALITAVLNPSLGLDSFYYHITSPKSYLLNHRILPHPYNLHSNWHYFTEMLYLWVLALYPNNFMLCKLIAVGYAVLMALGIYSCGRRFFSRETGLFGAAVFLLMHEVREFAPSAYIDFVMAFYTFMGFYILALWAVVSPSNKVMALASTMFGFAVAAKNYGLAFMITGFSALFVYLIFQSLITPKHSERHPGTGSGAPSLRMFSRQLGYAILPAMAVSFGWYIKNWIVTGNPLYPFLITVIPTRQEYYFMAQDLFAKFYGAPTKIPVTLEALRGYFDYFVLYLHNVAYIDINKLFPLVLTGILLMVCKRVYHSRSLNCLMVFSVISLPVLVFVPDWRFILGFMGIPLVFFFGSVWKVVQKQRPVFYVTGFLLISVLVTQIAGEIVYTSDKTRKIFRFGRKVYTSERAIGEYYGHSVKLQQRWEGYDLLEFVNTGLGAECILLITLNSRILPLIDVPFLPNMHMISADMFELMTERQHLTPEEIYSYLKRRNVTHILTENAFEGDTLAMFQSRYLRESETMGW